VIILRADGLIQNRCLGHTFSDSLHVPLIMVIFGHHDIHLSLISCRPPLLDEIAKKCSFATAKAVSHLIVRL